jgi:protein-tyrosine phosphatase
MYNEKHEAMKKEAVADIIECLEGGYDGYYCDLHNEVFNTDYYIIGTYQAKEALKEYDVFEALELVQNYEMDNFGEVYTELSNPEKLINMLYYIIGDDVVCEMNEIDEFNDNWDYEADEETNKVIIEKMKELFDI